MGLDGKERESEIAIGIGELLSEHKCSDTIVMYVGDVCSWTDYFVITTVRSKAHSQGLLRHLYTFLTQNKINQLNHKKSFKETGWILLDCGNLVIHLMESEERIFYEIERLWFKGTILYNSNQNNSL
ncbi:MAG: ribosome silencing factor [Spirochaetales bacterium]|nr:ribosome silencing factor [Spirochaetales bacterium]